MKTCEKDKTMKYKMPTEKKVKCKFENHHFKLRLPFVGYADFESINIKLHYLDPEFRKEINKLRIKSKTHNVNSKVMKIIINKIIKYKEISKNKARKLYNDYINNNLNNSGFSDKSEKIKFKRDLDKIKEKYVEKYFNKLIDKIFDKWVEDGRPIEISDYEIEKYSELKQIKINELVKI